MTRTRVWSDAPAIAAAAVTAVVLAWAGWARHRNYWSGGFDLGIFDQAIWLMSRGHAPEVTIVGRSILADHVSPALFLFVPLYRVAATPLWLFAVQAVALVATVLPLRALARDVGVPPLVPTIATLLSAPILAAALFDFHPWTLAVPFIAWAALAARRGDVPGVTIAAIGVLVCRADLGWTLFSLLPVAKPQTRWRLAALGIGGLLVGVALPGLFGSRGHWETHYGPLGTGPLDAVAHPWRILDAVFTADAGYTLALILLPLGFLPAARPRWMAAIALAALPMMVSSFEGPHVPWFHYGAAYAPLAIAATVEALSRPLRLPQFRLVLLAGLALGLYFASPLSPNAPDEYRLWRVLAPESAADFDAAVRAVGHGESVAATNRALPHLTHRKEVWPYPAPFQAVTPAGIGPEPDSVAAAAVRVVIVDEGARAGAARRGFMPTDVDAGRLYVGRRR